MSNIPINLSGTLAADPQCRTLPSGRACASFRLAVNHWHLDKSTGEFVDDGTSWFAVDCYGPLASNVSMSLKQGMTVMVHGGLRIREWTTEEKSGRTPTVIAEHVGPDLRYGTANYQKSSGAHRSVSQQSAQSSASSGWGGMEDATFDRPGESAGAAQSATERPYPGTGTGSNASDGGYGSSGYASGGNDAADGSASGGDDEEEEFVDGTDENRDDDADDAGRTGGDAIARSTAAVAAPF